MFLLNCLTFFNVAVGVKYLTKYTEILCKCDFFDSSRHERNRRDATRREQLYFNYQYVSKRGMDLAANGYIEFERK